jgi:hypothetical protein
MPGALAYTVMRPDAQWRCAILLTNSQTLRDRVRITQFKRRRGSQVSKSQLSQDFFSYVSE